MNLTPDPVNQMSWVVFTGQTDLPILKMLRPGFRHCYALINDGQHWISMDPMLHRLDIQVQPPDASFDLPGWLQMRGLTVIQVPQNNLKPKIRLNGLPTCVGLVKRLLGIRAPFALTPWQLYRHLQTTKSDMSYYSPQPVEGAYSHGKSDFTTLCPGPA